MILNLLLSFFKLAAGYIGSSHSIIADGIHSLSDCSTDIALLVGLKYWAKPADLDHPYGHRRIEAMVSAFIGFVLALAAVILSYDAVTKFKTCSFALPDKIAFFVALASIVTKEWLYRWTYKVARQINSSAMKANAWHHRSDAFSSVAVAFATGATILFPEWGILDPVATLVVSFFILHTAYKIILPALQELSDAGAEEEDLATISDLALGIQGVKSIHALRTRFYGPRMQVDLHVLVDAKMSVEEGHKIAGTVKWTLINEGPGITDVLVHVEPWHEDKKEDEKEKSKKPNPTQNS